MTALSAQNKEVKTRHNGLRLFFGVSHHHMKQREGAGRQTNIGGLHTLHLKQAKNPEDTASPHYLPSATSTFLSRLIFNHSTYSSILIWKRLNPNILDHEVAIDKTRTLFRFCYCYRDMYEMSTSRTAAGTRYIWLPIPRLEMRKPDIE
jgi:hypothetical protein